MNSELLKKKKLLSLKICFHLQSKAFSANGDDTSLGHMVVLLQYDWPKSEALFFEVLKKIKQQNSLVYNMFFNYIISILL